MEHKAKRIGKFNIIDILAVILIVAVLAFVGLKLTDNDGTTPEVQLVDLTYVVKVEAVAPELYENCAKHLPARLMASGALINGEVISVEKEDYLVMNDGEWVADPNHVNLLFTVETQAKITDVMTTKVGDQEVRIGKADHILKTENIEFQDATIVDVYWGE